MKRNRGKNNRHRRTNIDSICFLAINSMLLDKNNVCLIISKSNRDKPVFAHFYLDFFLFLWLFQCPSFFFSQSLSLSVSLSISDTLCFYVHHLLSLFQTQLRSPSPQPKYVCAAITQSISFILLCRVIYRCLLNLNKWTTSFMSNYYMNV